MGLPLERLARTNGILLAPRFDQLGNAVGTAPENPERFRLDTLV